MKQKRKTASTLKPRGNLRIKRFQDARTKRHNENFFSKFESEGVGGIHMGIKTFDKQRGRGYFSILYK